MAPHHHDQQPVLGRLDDKTLQELANLICGDDGPYYRQGRQLAQFLIDAGWTNTDDYDGDPRYRWILGQLRARRDNPADIRAVLLRLCDAREYLGEPPDTVTHITQALNRFLTHEGYKIQRPAGRPTLVECAPGEAAATTLAPVTLKATMNQIIDDPHLAAIMQSRLDEAQTCTSNGCHLAAIILLGSLLEGALLHTARTRLPQTAEATIPTTLYRLLKLAHQHKWIGTDVLKYPCDALREYRNLIHPNAQLEMEGEAPDDDTLTIAWPIVNAALNDLAATHRPNGRLPNASSRDS
ncbi:hypothetical protein ACFYTC_26860 [Actinomadura nitritigenes]|uniref:hypothetical protein n=1 Tax=Actinomadura nitritigenes TaxID=134602 RepID=UPI003677E3E3